MSKGASEQVGAAMLDAMIARATASCERSRAKLVQMPTAQTRRVQRLLSTLKSMESALARLIADREGRRE